MSKPFRDLRKKLSPQAQQKIAEKTAAMPRQNKIYIPIATIILVGATFVTSILVSWLSHDSFFSSVKSSELLQYGAINYQNLVAGEWWRLFTCQLLHVHFSHMIFNVVMCLALGWFVERIVGSI